MTKRIRYPWCEWKNGRVWQIKRGSNFNVSVVVMLRTLMAQARRAGARVAIGYGADAIVFQFFKDAT